MVLLSTTSDADLSAGNSAVLICNRELPPLAEVSLLEFPNKWFVGSRDGCSCGFRHLHTSAVELGFDTPKDWYPEESEDLSATLEFVGLVRQLLASGAYVDCIDAWGHESDTPVIAGTRSVDIANMPAEAFRFMENHRFVFGDAV
jgi:hypothetical protein